MNFEKLFNLGLSYWQTDITYSEYAHITINLETMPKYLVDGFMKRGYLIIAFETRGKDIPNFSVRFGKTKKPLPLTNREINKLESMEKGFRIGILSILDSRNDFMLTEFMSEDIFVKTQELLTDLPGIVGFTYKLNVLYNRLCFRLENLLHKRRYPVFYF